MAQELVLIPKSKYDYLVQQTEGHKEVKTSSEEAPNHSSEPEQRGGQANDNTYTDVGLSTSLSPSETMPDETEIKPSLFIKKPLSKMKFMRKSSGKKTKGNKRNQWINYTI